MEQFSSLVFFDDEQVKNLYPLTLTKPASQLLCGIFTIEEKWLNYFNLPFSYSVQDYLKIKYQYQETDNELFINSRVIPNASLVEEIKSLKNNQLLYKNDIIICRKGKNSNNLEQIQSEANALILERTHQIFTYNAQEIENDLDLICKNKTSQTLSNTNTIIGNGRVFIEEGAVVESSILNTKEGSIYIGKDAEIMEMSAIRGPFALLEHGVIKMGAKIYSGTTIGKYSKVGGEVNNSVVFNYSNKGHDGFLGNSVLGEWCNLGADTNNSNLKNNYEAVKLWNYATQNFEKTGLQFCGLIMGDHSKCGINTMFNTGTVVGVSSNIFGSGFPRNFVPSFSWGGAHGFEVYALKKAFQTVEIVMKRRNLSLTEADKSILEYVFNLETSALNY